MAKEALCIGINNYPGTHMDLKGCVNDANDWAAVLKARGFATTFLLDADATKAAMVAAFKKIIAGAVQGDTLAITFSGHGTYQPDDGNDEVDGLDEALCPYDLQTRGAALTDDEIRVLFAAMKPGVRLVLIADSCHSGTVTRAAPADEDTDAPRPRFMPMGNWLPESALPRNAAGGIVKTILAPTSESPFRGIIAKREGDLLLAGCKEGPNNYSYDAHFKARPNGAFTYYALKTLKTLKPEATYEEWYQRIIEHLPSASFPQSPQLVGSAAARRQRVLA